MSGIADTTPEQIALFADCYNRNGGDPVAACVEARIVNPMYSITTVAAHVMDMPETRAAIATMKKMRPTTAVTEITRESIMQDMQTIFDKWVSTDGKTAIAAKRLQAELGKMLGQDITINVKHDVTAMTDAQLAAIVAGKPIDVPFEDVTDITPKKQGIAQLSN